MTKPAPTKTTKTSVKRNTTSSSSRCEHDDTPGVTALVASLSHPLKPTLEAIRQAILSADTGITEGVKWNSPSFYCHGWFATINSHKPSQVDVVLHCGAKVRADCGVSGAVDDPDHLLSWPSKDRALLSFESDADFQARRQAFQRNIQQWAAYQKQVSR